MTIEELDAIHKNASWLIAKRSGKSAAKALTIGSESLDRTIIEIADMYDLSSSERRTLRPSIAEDIQSTAGIAADLLKTSAGIRAATDAAKVVNATKKAYQAGRVGKSLVTIATHGPKAAQTFAATGKLVGKFNPVVLGLTAVWTLGSAGYFAYHARAFNNAAYELRKSRLVRADEVSVSA